MADTILGIQARLGLNVGGGAQGGAIGPSIDGSIFGVKFVNEKSVDVVVMPEFSARLQQLFDGGKDQSAFFGGLRIAGGLSGKTLSPGQRFFPFVAFGVGGGSINGQGAIQFKPAAGVTYGFDGNLSNHFGLSVGYEGIFSDNGVRSDHQVNFALSGTFDFFDLLKNY